MIVLQPYKSSAANAYNIILVLFIAVGCFSVTIFDEAMLTIKAHWTVQTATGLITIICFLPSLVAIAWVAYCIRYKKYQAVWQMFSLTKVMRNWRI